MQNWERICDDYYGRVSVRVLVEMFVVAENVETIRSVAALPECALPASG